MTRRRRNTGFLLVGLLAALVIAGVGSHYASSSPDGLEWSAEKEGFLDTAEDSAAADSPLADYGISGVDGRLSGGLAGVIGVTVTLLLAGGITLLVRRRSGAPAEDAADDRVDASAPPTRGP